MGGTAVEDLPGGLLDRLVSIDNRSMPGPLADVRRLCAAGAYAAAIDGLRAGRDSTAPVIAAWRRYAWYCRWLGLPDGGARLMPQVMERMAELPPRPRSEAPLDAETWIVGELLPDLRGDRAMLSPDLATGAGHGTLDLIVEARAVAARSRPELVPHLDLIAADLAARGGDTRATWSHWQAAYQGMLDSGDHRGLAALAIVAGDLHAAPLTSPVSWNCVLATAPAPDNGLAAELEALEHTGSAARIEEATAAYEDAAGRYAAENDSAGLATVALRRAYLALLTGRPGDSVVLAHQAYEGFLAAARPLDAAVAATHRALAAIADDRLPVEVGVADLVVDAGNGQVGHAPAFGLGLLCARVGRHWAGAQGQPERAVATFGLAERIFAGLGEPRHRSQALVDVAQTAGALGDLAGMHVATMAALDADAEPFAEPADPLDQRRSRRAVLAGRLYVVASQARDVEAMDRSAQEIRRVVEPLRPRLAELTGNARMIARQLLSIVELPGQAVTYLVYQAREARDAGDLDRAATLCAEARAVLAQLPPTERGYDEAIVSAFEGDTASASAAFARHLTNQLGELAAGPDTAATRHGARLLHVQGMRFQLNVGAADRAREHFDVLRATGDPWWAGLGEACWHHQSAARLAELEGDLGTAVAEIERALAEVEQLRGALRRDELKASFFGGRDVQHVYLDAARIALRRREVAWSAGDKAGVERWSAAAFRYAERARGRALRDLMTASKGIDQSGLPADLIARWRGSTTAVALAQDRLARADQGGDRLAVPALRAELDAANRAQLDVEAELSRVDPRFWAAINPQTDIAELHEVSRALPPGLTVVQYVIGRTDLLAWALTSEGMVAAKRLSGENGVQRLVDAVVEACATGDRYEEPARKLASLLLEPLRPAIEASSALYVVPAGPTIRLPFAVLPWNGAPLGESYPLAVLPSASVLASPRSEAANPTRRPLVIGDPTEMAYSPAPGADPIPQPSLPAAAVEAAWVARLLPDSTLLIGPNATKERVRQLLPHASVGHLATHGILDADAPLASSILLAGGQNLTIAELLGLQLDTDLVILSACRTGTGDTVRGDELLGFGRALLAAGARAAIVTLWAINDLSAALLMSEFHRRRTAGATIQDALRHASEHIRGLSRERAVGEYEELRKAVATSVENGGPAIVDRARDVINRAGVASPYAHPRHWAPFVLITSGDATAR